MPAGRPREYDREAIAEAFAKYIEETEIPIVAEFAVSQGLFKQFIHDNEEFHDLVRKCTTKKESALERQSLKGGVNVTMAIFSLKQLGWSDRQDVTHKGDAMAPLVISPAAGKW